MAKKSFFLAYFKKKLYLCLLKVIWLPSEGTQPNVKQQPHEYHYEQIFPSYCFSCYGNYHVCTIVSRVH